MSEQQMDRLVTALDATSVEPDPDFVARLRRSVRKEALSSADSPIIRTHDLGEPVMTEVDTQSPEGSNSDPPQRWWSSRLALGLVAAGVLIVVGLAVGINALEDDEVIPAGGGAQTFGAESALQTTDAYFAAYNAGDFDAVLALFTVDATFRDSFSVEKARPIWEPRLAWELAGADSRKAPDCTVVDEVPGATVTLSCEFGAEDEVARSAGQVVPIAATITVTPGGISARFLDVGTPDWGDIDPPFTAWLAENYPEDADAAGCCGGDTVEESVARGELRASYAKLWGEYLEASG